MILSALVRRPIGQGTRGKPIVASTESARSRRGALILGVDDDPTNLEGFLNADIEY